MNEHLVIMKNQIAFFKIDHTLPQTSSHAYCDYAMLVWLFLFELFLQEWTEQTPHSNVLSNGSYTMPHQVFHRNTVIVIERLF